jgi:KUP system potassium uptake protein
VILFVLFAVQRGTGGIGCFFVPITIVWFVVMPVLGLRHIVGHPEILMALSPHHALRFMFGQPGTAFIILGAVVLCVTGAEALYADLGHFGKRPIRLAWFSIAMPALTLNYFGQGALLLERPDKEPFYFMAPDWALIPLVILATVHRDCLPGVDHRLQRDQAGSATRIPRLTVDHQRSRHRQIFIPAVNWGLSVAMCWQSSCSVVQQPAAAYGIAVTLDMLDHHHAEFFVIRLHGSIRCGYASRPRVFVVDLASLRSNLLKLVAGDGFPDDRAIFTLMTTWSRGRDILKDKPSPSPWTSAASSPVLPILQCASRARRFS